MTTWYICILAGLASGVFGSLLGVGGGLIMVPILVMLMHFPQKTAQGMSLAVMVPLALVGAIRYRMTPGMGMDLVTVGLMAVGAVAGAWLGASLVAQIPAVVVRRAFAVLMVLVAVRMFFTPEPPAKPAVAVEQKGAHADPGQ